MDTAYLERDRTLRVMGFGSYREYLSGMLWASIRSRVLSSRGPGCYFCGKKARVVHHRSYARPVLEGADLSPLYPLCHFHHKRVEIKNNEEKRSAVGAERMFQILLQRKDGRRVKRLVSRFSFRFSKRCVACPDRAARLSDYCRPCRAAAVTGVSQPVLFSPD